MINGIFNNYITSSKRKREFGKNSFEKSSKKRNLTLTEKKTYGVVNQIFNMPPTSPKDEILEISRTDELFKTPTKNPNIKRMIPTPMKNNSSLSNTQILSKKMPKMLLDASIFETFLNMPKKQKKLPKSNKFFKNPLKSFSRDLFTHTLSLEGIENHSSYQTPSGKIFEIIKQTTTKNCGPTCALMIILDYLQKNNSVKIFKNDKKYFFSWFNNCNGKAAKDIIKKIENTTFLKPQLLNFFPKNFEDPKIIKEEIFSKIKEKLNETQNSIMLLMDYENRTNHWVVVDEIKNNMVFIRDPATRKAYAINKEQLLEQVHIYEDEDLKFLPQINSFIYFN